MGRGHEPGGVLYHCTDTRRRRPGQSLGPEDQGHHLQRSLVGVWSIEVGTAATVLGSLETRLSKTGGSRRRIERHWRDGLGGGRSRLSVVARLSWRRYESEPTATRDRSHT